ncbi:hypothetical protein HBI56_177300 [Parastagonospora nodorum]|uniref:Uncharacterized protein n=1 Tax=Phaeosphaeria nodorum (strain SN15 / ATCC MYA-4574 / FGSC 10173) TaxID=321614 RepID=A0A7U2ESY9_PHANO|nr:hypothetical protein HBH56_048010 [Parastagonospora nodorum]QRC92486.1 hypothetical protein JI435_402550 [Parastagonospora nodorum SN15]KAH3932861.1 hypothetical protein HBH54_075750 [Parastagonospora nodorum]KAH3938874.1 hypothetical protein HBH53_243840 [Parastagonospora nodorum]KAH3957276.1 hypothetical protein HBH51_227120 [Parastagonospora nodorum]
MSSQKSTDLFACTLTSSHAVQSRTRDERPWSHNMNGCGPDASHRRRKNYHDLEIYQKRKCLLTQTACAEC